MDIHTQELIVKFLKNNFPVQRLKNNDRFQRGILIPKCLTGYADRKFFLRPVFNRKELFSSVYEILRSIFGVSPSEIIEAMKAHFNAWDIKS